MRPRKPLGWLVDVRVGSDVAGLPVSSHLFPEFSAQLLAISPHAHRLEYQDWAAPILERRLEIKDGFAFPQKEAGVGLAAIKVTGIILPQPPAITGRLRSILKRRMKRKGGAKGKDGLRIAGKDNKPQRGAATLSATRRLKPRSARGRSRAPTAT
jgi:hypothetical protein